MSEDTRRATSDCRHCRGGQEFFCYWDNLYEYDVERAKELVRDGREPVEVEEESARASVDECYLDEAHVHHVNPAYPGLIAHIWYPASDGEIIHAHVLIDGHHRAARCLAEQRPFFAYLLTEQESRDLLVRSPPLPPLEPVTAGALPAVAVPARVA